MLKQLFLLCLLLIPTVFAEDALRNGTDVNVTSINPENLQENPNFIYPPVVTTVSDDTKDTSIMTNGLGIKIRALQLQERIELAIFQARTITTKLSGINISTADKTAIYNAVTKLTQLKAQAQKINSTEQFVSIKKEAITTIAGAREIVQRVFSNTQKADIKFKIKNLELDAIKATREKIKITIRSYKNETNK